MNEEIWTDEHWHCAVELSQSQAEIKENEDENI